jgi:hypothetical protein
MTRSEQKRLAVQSDTKTGTDLCQRLPVSLVWMAVFNPPEGMEDWQFYRIEYGGHAESCIVEGGIWLPPWAEPDDIESYLTRTQRRTG